MREHPTKPEASFDEVFSIAHGEMVALAARGGPLGKRLFAAALEIPARALARSLVALDRDLARGSLRDAALARLRHYGAEARLDLGAGRTVRLAALDPSRSPLPAEGPLLVVSNHPGLFDALALFAAIGREDLAILAARRPLLTALPHLSRRLLLIDPGASGAVALKMALRHLRGGGALLHFPAGRIEPDPLVSPRGTPLLLPWKAGIGTLLDVATRLLPTLRAAPALVSGVISPRALTLARAAGWAGGDALTDALVPLLQLTFPGFRDTDLRVRFGEDHAVGTGLSARLREELAQMALAASPPRRSRFNRGAKAA